MSQPLVLELNDEVYAILRQQADAEGLSLAEWVLRTLIQRSAVPPNAENEPQAAALLSLPPASRALLADTLVESLEFDIDADLQAAWISEAKQRRDQIRDGSVQPIPGEDALNQVRQLLDP